MDSSKRKVHIIGGGYSGLTLAYYLINAGFAVEIFEKSDRLGGLLGTHYGDLGFVEQAANAFLANRELEKISKDIGVPLFEKSKVARRRYIFTGGRPRRWPVGFVASLRIFAFIFKYLFVKNMVKPRSHETLSEWGCRHLGKEVTEKLLGTAMQGIYVDRPENLSASLTLASLFSREKSQMGRLRGSVSPAKGMQEWIDGLGRYLLTRGCVINLNTEKSLGDASVPTVVATDLKAAQKLLQATPHFKAIGKAASADISSVSILLAEGTARPAPGFGCLFPPDEGFNSLGVLFNNDIFSDRTKGCVSETWIFASTYKVNSPAEAKNYFVSKVLADRQRLVGQGAQVLSAQIFQWPQAIPVYSVELEKILIELKGEQGNIFLMGNYLGQLGLSKIIYRAKELAQTITEKGQWQNMV